MYQFLKSNPELLHVEGVNADDTLNVQWLEALRPNKSDVLPYLTHDSGQPDRWAKALVAQTIDGAGYLNYYAIGPLPVTAKTQVQPLTWPYQNKRNGIQSVAASFEKLMGQIQTIGANVSDITKELLGDYIRGTDPFERDGLRVNIRSTYVEEGLGYLWCGFMRTGPRSSAWSILPEGLFFKLRVSASADVGFDILAWYYNGEYYNSADDLREAIKTPGFIRAARNEDGDWTSIEDLTDHAERAAPPPVMVQPYGPRYSLDRDAQYVSYMGWTFYFTSYVSTGLMLYDIRFQNHSVMYELGLNEAMAHYAGDDPIQGGQEFLDCAFGMGKFSFELVPGYDCPAYADYFDSTYHLNGKKWTNKNSICLFEYTADYLLQRHTSQYQVTVSKNTYLLMRYVATVGNYDYTIDYIMYLDGTLEVKVRASGFIFGAFRSNTTSNDGPHHPPGTEADKYGYRIHDAISSSMHDHVISFRADMDIAGQPNTFQRVAIEPVKRSYSWEQPEIPLRESMALHEYPIDHETGLDWPANSGEMYIVSHATATNKWNERRSYRITPGTGMGTPPHLTIKNSTSLGKAATWATHDLWVVRQRDTERASADPLNWFAPHAPLLDFDDVADNEPLGSESDLVLYFNLGAHHVPHSGDLPNTLMHTSASGVAFVPHNFLDRDPSRATSQGVRLALKGGNGAQWMLAKQHSDRFVGGHDREGGLEGLEYFGGRYEDGVRLGREDLEPGLEGYGAGQGNREAVLDLGGTLVSDRRAE